MVDTPRTRAVLQTTFLDNNAFLITPQNARDFIVSAAFLNGDPGGQTLIGGLNAADGLTLQTTAGVGIGSDTITFKAGNNGAVSVATMTMGGIHTGLTDPTTQIAAPSFGGNAVTNVAIATVSANGVTIGGTTGVPNGLYTTLDLQATLLGKLTAGTVGAAIVGAVKTALGDNTAGNSGGKETYAGLFYYDNEATGGVTFPPYGAAVQALLRGTGTQDYTYSANSAGNNGMVAAIGASIAGLIINNESSFKPANGLLVGTASGSDYYIGVNVVAAQSVAGKFQTAATPILAVNTATTNGNIPGLVLQRPYSLSGDSQYITWAFRDPIINSSDVPLASINHHYLGSSVSSLEFGASPSAGVSALTNIGLIVYGTGMNAPQAFFTSGTISPAAITGNVNDYAPTGAATATFWRLSNDGAHDITGISASQTAGRQLILTNASAGTFTLKHNSASSSAGNKFACPGSVDFSFTAGMVVHLIYDGAASFWLVK